MNLIFALFLLAIGIGSATEPTPAPWVNPDQVEVIPAPTPAPKNTIYIDEGSF